MTEADLEPLSGKTCLLGNNFDLVVGNPPWESRGKKQIALDFAKHTPDFLRAGGIGCLLLPSTILVNRHGTLDGDWFRNMSVEKIVQLVDFRFVLFEATHPCFIMRWRKTKPTPEHVVTYETRRPCPHPVFSWGIAPLALLQDGMRTRSLFCSPRDGDSGRRCREQIIRLPKFRGFG
jgi:hypothetical protein